MLDFAELELCREGSSVAIATVLLFCAYNMTSNINALRILQRCFAHLATRRCATIEKHGALNIASSIHLHITSCQCDLEALLVRSDDNCGADLTKCDLSRGKIAGAVWPRFLSSAPLVSRNKIMSSPHPWIACNPRNFNFYTSVVVRAQYPEYAVIKSGDFVSKF